MPSSTYHPRARSRRLVAAVSLVVALVSGVVAYGSVRPISTVSLQLFVDTPAPSVVQRPNYPVEALTRRAELLGRMMTSPALAEPIARLAKVPPDQLATAAHTTASLAAAFREPASEERAAAIPVADRPYRIEVEARTNSPVLDVYAQAPSTEAAKRLANAAHSGLEQRLRALADEEGVPVRDRVVVRKLGSARGGAVNSGLARAVGFVAFLLTFALAFALLRHVTREPARPRRRSPAVARPEDMWPHTTRLLPWTIACFLAVPWLMPFEDIQLDIPLPIDLGFDRLVLPFVVGAWGLAWLRADSAAPRLRLTRIHLAVGAFVLCAFMSVLVNAGSLNQTLELEAALKQLPLLAAYVCFFVIASSAIRARELPAFLTYTLALAVVCALGTIWEYRFKQNLFYDWSGKLLPGIFRVPVADTTLVDDIGRRLVRGPCTSPLETVAMLSMALAIPLVRLTQPRPWHQRFWYGLAACLLFAAAFATMRKTALLAPVSVVLTVAYYRRRELLKLAPLGLVVVLLIPLVTPGAIGLTTSQFGPGRLGVATVSDRSADYDAVRPELWSHLLFGRGWGSYDHVTYRVLDSEILRRLIEMGVLGLLSFVVMVGSVIWAARATISSRNRTWAPLALTGTAAAVSFAVASILFDVLAFPHAVYIFLYMAGLVAAVVAHQEHAERPSEHPRPPAPRIPRRPVDDPPPRTLAANRAR